MDNTSTIIHNTSGEKTLSFIIPLYNSSKWLEKCLYSVLNQDIPESDMEIICVNDGSPDNSADLVREIAKTHPAIIVIDQPNQGPSGARNTGMKAATGKYLCFVDPDDFVEPNVYGRLVQQMEDEQLDMLRFNYQIVDEQYQHVEKRPFEKRFDYSPKLMTGAEFIATRLDIACNIWRYMYRREIITKNEIWCFTGDYYDDTPWLPLVLLKAERMNICDTVVYNYLVRDDSLVKTKKPMMMKRKSDGAVLLLKYLEEELNELMNEGVNETIVRDESRKELTSERMNKCTVHGVRCLDDRWRDGVIAWYKMIEAHVVGGLLTDVGVYLYAERECYLRQLKELNVFPLTHENVNKKGRRKVRLANISPRLLVWVLHLKSMCSV